MAIVFIAGIVLLPLVTVLWLALTPANKHTGVLRIMPESHREGLDHYETGEDEPGVADGASEAPRATTR